MVEIIFKFCNNLGNSFGFGTFEGAIIILGILTYGYLLYKKGGIKEC